MGAELHGTKPLFPASLCSSLETISLGRRALSRPRSLLHMRSCIRRLFSRKPEVLNPCQGDGASVDLYLLFLSRKVRTRRKASAAVASCAGLRSFMLLWRLRLLCVVLVPASTPLPYGRPGAVGARLPTSHAGHQTPFPLNFHRKSFLPGGAGTRHHLALRGGRRLKLAVPGWCPAEGHGVCSGGNAAF